MKRMPGHTTERPESGIVLVTDTTFDVPYKDESGRDRRINYDVKIVVRGTEVEYCILPTAIHDVPQGTQNVRRANEYRYPVVVEDGRDGMRDAAFVTLYNISLTIEDMHGVKVRENMARHQFIES